MSDDCKHTVEIRTMRDGAHVYRCDGCGRVRPDLPFEQFGEVVRANAETN